MSKHESLLRPIFAASSSWTSMTTNEIQMLKFYFWRFIFQVSASSPSLVGHLMNLFFLKNVIKWIPMKPWETSQAMLLAWMFLIWNSHFIMTQTLSNVLILVDVSKIGVFTLLIWQCVDDSPKRLVIMTWNIVGLKKSKVYKTLRADALVAGLPNMSTIPTNSTVWKPTLTGHPVKLGEKVPSLRITKWFGDEN